MLRFLRPAPRTRVACAALMVTALASASLAAPPTAAKRPVTDAYWGERITDDYRWLEDGSAAEVQRWTAGEDSVAHAFLDSIPFHAAVESRVVELTTSLSPSWFGLVRKGPYTFALRNQPPRQQAELVRIASVDDTSGYRTVLDPVVVDPSGSTTIDFFVPSHDGARVAVSLSSGGTETGDVVIVETATGRMLPDRIERVNGGTAGGSVAWNGDGSTLWYTRYPRRGERPDSELEFWQDVWVHRVGSPAGDDKRVLGGDLPKIAEIALEASDDGRHVLANVSNGDGGEHEFWLGGEGEAFRRITRFADQAVKAWFLDDRILMLSYRGALNGRLLTVPIANPSLAAAKTFVAEGDAAIQDVEVTPKRVFVRDLIGGPSQVRVFDHAGRALGAIALPPVSAVSQLLADGDTGVLLRHESFLEPERWSRWTESTKTLTPTALVTRSPADFSGFEVRREFAVSKDGTRVPLNILIRKGAALDGRTPTILYGYGGYGLSQTPGFSASRLTWLEQGCALAIANLRGGGEYGEAWHRAGNLTKKQNVFDDMAACAEHLIRRGYTSVDRLGLNGGSNGGLLMGALVTQHPDRFRAVASSVGIYDMLRVELHPNGAFNVTEFGTVRDSAQYRALRAYSPYHHVRDGVKYPAVLFTTGSNDPRVDPMHSRKMTARMQAATASDRPILLRARSGVGHGGGSPLSIRQQQIAEFYSFMFSQLGVAYRKLESPVP